MARITRAEVFDPSQVAVLHVMNRCVRRCFLMGDDPVTGKNFDHRKTWLENRLQHLASCFGIDLLCFSILSNHFHLILRSRPDVVESWDDTQVAQRWLQLCPVRKNKQGVAKEPSEAELNAIRKRPERLATIRRRLSDISWWMRLLSQPLAVLANQQENEQGRFWQGRFKAVKLCDEAAILSCAAYVDLNPIRAALAQSIETSAFTSIQRRMQSVSEEKSSDASALRQDRFLAPISIDELRDSIGAMASSTPYRASDKGFLSMSTIEYIQLLDWTARNVVHGKPGATPANAPSVLSRLGVDRDDWCMLVKDFGKLFYLVAGMPKTLANERSLQSKRAFHVPIRFQELVACKS